MGFNYTSIPFGCLKKLYNMVKEIILICTLLIALPKSNGRLNSLVPWTLETEWHKYDYCGRAYGCRAQHAFARSVRARM